MRTQWITTGLLSVAVLLGPSAIASAASCRVPARAVALDRTERALLYEARDRARIVGCWRRSGRRTTVFDGRISLGGYKRTYADLTRQFAVVEVVSLGRDMPQYSLRLVDLRTGQLRWRVDPTQFERPVRDSDTIRSTVQRVRVTKDADAVYTVRNRYTEDTKRQVYAVVDEVRHILDPGPYVDTASLMLRGRTASWVSGGVRVSRTI